MTDIKYLSPRTDQCILPTHIEVLSRALRGVGVISGNAIFPTDPPSMAVVVSAGTIRIGPDVLDVSEQTVNISPSDETLYRIDVVYRDTSGNAQVLTGVPAEIINPNQLPSWTGYISPSPPEDIPDGVILGVVFVPAETETIQASCIWELAAGVEDPVLVGDIVTSVGSPGDNSHVPSEAAVRTLADTKLNLSDIVTTLGNPGSNSKVPSEKAVRDVFNLLGVTNGNNHDHYGGDGAQISHSTLSNLTADDHTQYLNTARHDTTARHGSSVVDHGSIGGLSDDDHTQYLNTTRHDTTARHTPGTVVPVVTSVGNPGSDSNIPTEKAVRNAINAVNVSRAINVQFENGGYVLEANQAIWVQLPNANTTITGLQMVANTTGSVVVNVMYATYSSYPTTYDQCGSSAKPTLSNAQKYSTDCSSWSRKTFSAGDWVVFIIESCSTITRLNISLNVV